MGGKVIDFKDKKINKKEEQQKAIQDKWYRY